MRLVQHSLLDKLELRDIDQYEFLGQSQELVALFEMAEKAHVDRITFPELKGDANLAVRGIILATAIEVSDPASATTKTLEALSSDGSAYMLNESYSRLVRKCLESPDEPSSRTMSVTSIYSGRELRNRMIVL
jgi:hypothetical protein